MTGENRALIAFCGLYCGDCLRLGSRAAELAAKLRAELEKSRFAEYVQVKSEFAPEFQDYPDFLKVLQAVIDLDCPSGCRKGGCPGLDCAIRACCLDKQLDGCWECDGLDQCDRFDFLTPWHGDVVRHNLRPIRALGPEAWLERRPLFYVWLKTD
ncbi:MAG: DUF3795 domain-containing protein [Proteobacteria bacterium]|nr:DUF3795 domain-containing protein [Pseudomonadota bacterium]